MTTRKELFTNKYIELYNNLTKIINTDFFPDIKTVDFLDLIFLLNFTFKDTTQDNFKKTIDDLLEIYGIKLDDDIKINKVYPLLFEFIFWYKALK